MRAVLHLDVGRRLDERAECEQVFARRAAAVVAEAPHDELVASGGARGGDAVERLLVRRLRADDAFRPGAVPAGVRANGHDLRAVVALPAIQRRRQVQQMRRRAAVNVQPEAGLLQDLREAGRVAE